MRTLIILVFLFSVPLQGFSQYFPIDTTRLNQSYTALVHEPNSIEKQKKFLETFPSTFSEFIMVYQFVPDPNYDLTMYRKAPDHVLKGLKLLTLIPDTIYCDKLINLSINGRWMADAPNYLKTVLQEVMGERTKIMFSRLSKKTVGQQFSFWYFYFNNPVIKQNFISKYENLKQLLSDSYPAMVNEMESAFKASYGKADISEDYPHLRNKK
jgi:hypothetical protein